ncbi:MAG: hypothetical protein O2921_00235 [Chloroflexi bacterium]|nr:hypothetical protein [Chloroflexota bacterium]MDA1281046.1 hypothetical protein [Chloroflexota bacterium]
MEKLVTLNPVAEMQLLAVQTDIAPRPKSLDGLKIGLVWNRKRGGDAVLTRVGEELSKQYKNVSVKLYEGGIPAPTAVLDQAAEESDVVVGSSSD